MQKWEYYVKTLKLFEFDQDELNKLGARGWELVSVVGIEIPHTGLEKFTYFFKRPIETAKKGE